MYAEPETSFGDITRYFEERDIKVYGKSLTRSYLSQLLRNPVYAQADLEKYEFFKRRRRLRRDKRLLSLPRAGCEGGQGQEPERSDPCARSP